MRFALPTEKDIHNVVIGSHSTSGGSAITKEEVFAKYHLFRKGKMGVREKVLEVIERKCVEEEDKLSGKKFLKWKNH